jgi:oligopeptide/dipeptide ABC transporter ATP-binding protein
VSATVIDPLEAAPATAPLLEVRDLRRDFHVGRSLLPAKRATLRAVDGVSFSLQRAETLGLVGESGSGKTTVGRLVAQSLEPTAGTIRLAGDDVFALDRRGRRAVRRRVQMIFQDPYSSFDSRARLGSSLEEPLIVHEHLSKDQRRARIVDLVERVGLTAGHLDRYPSQLSGGQLQRLAIARALALLPGVLVCDEPVSALDVSIQAQVVNLLGDLQTEFGLAYLFISHDLSVVQHLSHRVAVMYLGRIVEIGDAAAVSDSPGHPYTQALLSAVPYPAPKIQRARRRIVVGGEVPSPIDPPSGCHFSPRCPYAMEICRIVDPPEYTTRTGAVAACHLHEHGPRLAGESVNVLLTGATHQSSTREANP